MIVSQNPKLLDVQVNRRTVLEKAALASTLVWNLGAMHQVSAEDSKPSLLEELNDKTILAKIRFDGKGFRTSPKMTKAILNHFKKIIEKHTGVKISRFVSIKDRPEYAGLERSRSFFIYHIGNRSIEDDFFNRQSSKAFQISYRSDLKAFVLEQVHYVYFSDPSGKLRLEYSRIKNDGSMDRYDWSFTQSQEESRAVSGTIRNIGQSKKTKLHPRGFTYRHLLKSRILTEDLVLDKDNITL